ncbi:MAG: hypothetical protein P4M11_15685, partial [Candidatus Pacebacteria bacterium]|nr:hypothetical protein [Candidatus Paceibacterota bacterium]
PKTPKPQNPKTPKPQTQRKISSRFTQLLGKRYNKIKNENKMWGSFYLGSVLNCDWALKCFLGELADPNAAARPDGPAGNVLGQVNIGMKRLGQARAFLDTTNVCPKVSIGTHLRNHHDNRPRGRHYLRGRTRLRPVAGLSEQAILRGPRDPSRFDNGSQLGRRDQDRSRRQKQGGADPAADRQEIVL